MSKGRYFQLFSSLSTKERTLCSDFLASPYYNSRPKLKKLHDTLTQLAELGIEISKDVLFKKAFKGVSFTDQEIRHLLSYYSKCLKKFLALQEWEADDHNQRYLLCRSLRKRELNKLFEGEWETAL